MYGTRDVPRLWQEELGNTLKKLGFMESPTNVGYVYHEQLGIEAIVHVDDILFTGVKQQLDEMYRALSQKY